MATNYYDVLGISSQATEDDIRRAYRQKARELHPDTNPDDPDANIKFQQVQEAYETLSDPVSRRQYDSPGIGSFSFPGGFTVSFGGGPTIRPTIIPLTLEQVLLGATYRKSDGQDVNIPPGMRPGMPMNLGNGEVYVAQYLHDPRFQIQWPHLISRPQNVNWIDLLLGCKLEIPAIPQDQKHTIDLPRGYQPHEKPLRLAGAGLPLGNGQFGDIYTHVIPLFPETLDPELERLLQEYKNTRTM